MTGRLVVIGEIEETIMIKPRLGSLLFMMAACAMPGSALSQPPQGDPVYHIYYYSEPNGEVVGIHYGDCTYWGPVTHAWLEGETSPYSEPIVAGYCYQGVWQPL